MLLSALFTLCAGVLGRAVDDVQQLPLVTESVLRKIPGGSIVNLCPESKDSDLLAINRIVNEPQNPYLNEEQHVFIWGNFTQNISEHSTVTYQINATANNGDSGALKSSFHICEYLEKMHQPPGTSQPDVACPPISGPVFINYEPLLIDLIIAPGYWSVKFDAKTPEGDRIYCLQAEFDLQCLPDQDGPECMRDTPDKLDVGWMAPR